MSAPPPSPAIQRIASLARAGRLNEAALAAVHALAEHPEDGALLALAGAVDLHRRHYAGAAAHLRKAYKQRGDDIVVRANLVEALYHIGDHAEALSLCDIDRAKADRSLRIARFGGHLAQQVDDHAAAVALYRIAVSADPKDWSSWNNLGNALADVGEVDEGVAALRRAIELAPDAPPMRINLGQRLKAAGRWDEAEKVWQEAAVAFPDDHHPCQALFGLYTEIGRPEEAYAAIRAAASRAPDEAELQADFGQIAGQNNDFSDAEAAFERALARNPALDAAYVGLAAVLERTNREAELAALRQRASANGVGDRALAFIDASMLQRAGQFAEALATLERASEVVLAARYHQLQGQLLDRLGQHDAAFAAFAAMNAAWQDDPSRPRVRAQAYRAEIARKTEAMTATWLAQWSPPPPADDIAAPVFLVGFPRSGTTLLDTMLMAHPAVGVLEEEPFIGDIEAELGGFDGLAEASPAALQEARASYLARARTVTGVTTGGLLVDKHPMHLAKVPAIMRLFPDAKFILALRHPCDVLLSCYTTNFRLNDAMANFLDLKDAASLYDLAFTQWCRAAELFRPATRTVVYERLVENPVAELQPLFAWLGLAWREEAADHREAARARGAIRTASYAQVTEPVYQRSRGRWQFYRHHLAPIIPTIKPWIVRFGYALERFPVR